MRHRITSFRCVEAVANMSLRAVKRKTCNEVNIRQFSCASRARQRYVRQSSITRDISDQDGTTSVGAEPTLKATRPRLNAIASSSGSKAPNSAVKRAVAGLKLAGALRLWVLVQIDRNGAAALAGLARATRRVARVQPIVICGCEPAPTNVASLPPAVAV